MSNEKRTRPRPAAAKTLSAQLAAHPIMQDRRSLDELEKEAHRLRERLQAREAIALYERVIEKDPTRADAHAGLGFCWQALHDYERALKHFEKAIELQPMVGRSLYGIALTLLELGRWSEATLYARNQAALGDPENQARGLYVLGLIDYARAAYRDAVLNLEESLSIQPRRRRSIRATAGEIRHHYVLADCYRELNEPRSAIEHLKWVADRSERGKRTLNLELAALFLELQEDRQAERCYQTVLEERPSDRQARLGLGRVYLQRHDYARAIEMFSAVLKGAADDLDALNGLAEAYKGKGDLDRALGYLEQIRRRHRTPQGQLERKLRALQLERERRDAELLRVRNIAALNLMATGIAHELRQPLSLIRLAAQNARKDLEEGEQTYLQQDLADIDRSVAQIDKVIAVLRDISSPEGPTDEVVDLAEVLDEALSLFRTQLSHREIAIETNDLAGQRVLASRAALRQVLVNLISNARDALESTHEKRIRIWAIQGASDYWIYFQDNGCGMDAAIRDQAFDPFFTTKKDGGTGLGLYICHSLMRRMGGSISLKETAPGRGAKFELRLHRAPDPSDAALKEAADERKDQ